MHTAMTTIKRGTSPNTDNQLKTLTKKERITLFRQKQCSKTKYDYDPLTLSYKYSSQRKLKLSSPC